MTEVEKKAKEIEILGLMKEFLNREAPTDAILYVRGDSEFNLATVKIEGNVKLLGQTIIHHIEQNEEFRRFMYAMLGSFLSQNPVAHAEFNKGIELIKLSFNMN